MEDVEVVLGVVDGETVRVVADDFDGDGGVLVKPVDADAGWGSKVVPSDSIEPFDGQPEPEPEPEAEKVEPEKTEPTEKQATVAEILETVGDDADLAAVALDMEMSEETPRVSLIDGLEKVIAAGNESDGEA